MATVLEQQSRDAFDRIFYFFTEDKPLSLKTLFDYVKNYFACAVLFGIWIWFRAGAPGLIAPELQSQVRTEWFYIYLTYVLVVVASALVVLNTIPIFALACLLSAFPIYWLLERTHGIRIAEHSRLKKWLAGHPTVHSSIAWILEHSFWLVLMAILSVAVLIAMLTVLSLVWLLIQGSLAGGRAGSG
jgi:hypothetical protein